MPSSIPYDPSLVLTSVVSEKAIQNVGDIAAAQGPLDAAQDSLNSLISSKRGLLMTQTELKNLGINTKALEEELNKVNESIEKAAATYAKEKVAAEGKIMELRKNIRMVHADVESPIDHLKTEIKSLPLAADTMNMDVQYFPHDSNSQNAATFSSQIAAYVTKTTGSVFGPGTTVSIADAVTTQVSRQVQTQDIAGTLVLSVTCTHKNASVLAPFNLHVDKAIKVWNRLFPGKKLDPTSKDNMMKVAKKESQEDKEKFSIVSGVAFGSSFIGMVHILNSTDPQVSETIAASANSMQEQSNSRAWLSNVSGTSRVDKKFASDLKNLLSQQNVTSQITVLSTGTAENIKQAALPQGSTTTEGGTMEYLAQAARTGSQANEHQANKIESSLNVLGVIDEKDKVPDINSMMNELDAFLAKAAAGTGGVPINYYLKDIDAKMLAEMWAAKYYPGKFMSMKLDASEEGGPALEQV